MDPARVAPEQVDSKLFEAPALLMMVSQTQVDQMTDTETHGRVVPDGDAACLRMARRTV
jgi:hypothetical protein